MGMNIWVLIPPHGTDVQRAPNSLGSLHEALSQMLEKQLLHRGWQGNITNIECANGTGHENLVDALSGKTKAGDSVVVILPYQLRSSQLSFLMVLEEKGITIIPSIEVLETTTELMKLYMKLH